MTGQRAYVGTVWAAFDCKTSRTDAGLAGACRCVFSFSIFDGMVYCVSIAARTGNRRKGADRTPTLPCTHITTPLSKEMGREGVVLKYFSVEFRIDLGRTSCLNNFNVTGQACS